LTGPGAGIDSGLVYQGGEAAHPSISIVNAAEEVLGQVILGK